MERVLTDSGFWFGFYNKHDTQFHDLSVAIMRNVVDNAAYDICIPMPILYEVLNTHFTKNKRWLADFREKLSKPNVIQIDDTPYREKALEHTLTQETWNLSFVDSVLTHIIDDKSLRFAYMLTYDYAHFSKVCANRELAIYFP